MQTLLQARHLDLGHSSILSEVVKPASLHRHTATCKVGPLAVASKPFASSPQYVIRAHATRGVQPGGLDPDRFTLEGLCCYFVVLLELVRDADRTFFRCFCKLRSRVHQGPASTTASRGARWRCAHEPERLHNLLQAEPRTGSVLKPVELRLLAGPAGRGLVANMLFAQGTQRPHLQHSVCALGRLSSRPQIRRSQKHAVSHRRSRCQATNLDFDALLFDCDGVLCDTEAEGHRVRTTCPTSLLSLCQVWT